MFQIIQQKLQSTQKDQNSLLSLGVKTAITKAFSALFAFLLTVIVSRTADASIAGQFFFLFNLVSLIAIVSQRGFDVALIRYNAIAYSSADIQQQSNNYRTALVRSMAFSFVAGAVLFGAFYWFPDLVNKINAPMLAVGLALLCVPFLVLGQTNSRVLQASKKVISSLFALQLGVSVLMVIFIAALNLFNLSGITHFVVALLLACVIVASTSTVIWCRSDQFRTPTKLQDNQLLATAKQVWVGSIFNNLLQWGSLVIAGFFIAASDLGLLAAAQRTSLLIGFVLITINFVIAPMFASLYKEGNMDKLRHLSRMACRLNIVVALIPVLVCTLFPAFIMQFFGEEFVPAAPLLVVLSIGQLINVATGSVGLLLLMSRHERTMKYITICSGTISAILLTVLCQSHGVLGAAWAMATGMAIQNVAALYFVKRYLGFFPVG